MDFAFFFKRLSILFVVLLLWTACNIPRDNVLDPKNPDSYCPRKTIIEAFVNTGNPFSYNQYMLSALDSLSQLYSDRLVIVEYHRNTDQYNDNYHINENELLYQHYLNATGSSLKGVPDVFINGVFQRVQGASSVHSALFRLQQAVLTEISANSHFTLELAYEITKGKLTPIVTLARLGSTDAREILLKAVLTSQIEEIYLKRVVRGSVKSSIIPILTHSEVKIYTLPELNINESFHNQLIVYITDQNERTILQCESIAVE